MINTEIKIAIPPDLVAKDECEDLWFILSTIFLCKKYFWDNIIVTVDKTIIIMLKLKSICKFKLIYTENILTYKYHKSCIVIYI